MLVYNWLGLLMLFGVGGLGWLLSLVAGKAAWSWALGVGLFIVDIGWRLWRARPKRDRFSALVVGEAGGAFFYLPVWVWAVLVIVSQVVDIHIVTLMAATALVFDVAQRAWRARLNRSNLLKALVDPKLDSIFLVIPLWIAAVVVLWLMYSVGA